MEEQTWSWEANKVIRINGKISGANASLELHTDGTKPYFLVVKKGIRNERDVLLNMEIEANEKQLCGMFLDMSNVMGL